jgi:hypothetical protein
MIVTLGYPGGCIVTRGYGCPSTKPIPPVIDTCDIASEITKRVNIASIADASSFLLSFVTTHVECDSMVTTTCNMDSEIDQIVDIISIIDSKVVIELDSYITLTVDLDSQIGCG